MTPRVDPGEAGFHAGRLARVDAFVEAEVAARRLPGAVLGIVRGGALVRLDAFGMRDPQAGAPMTTDTLFWLASMTKPVTAAGALLLVESGELVLEEAVGDYLPGFRDRRVADPESLRERPAARQPTVLDLMRHTAGIPEGLLGRTALHARYAEAVGDGMTGLDGPEFVARLAALPLLADPGTLWHYGFGFDLLGQIVESVTSDTLGAFLARRLFAPLGMTDTRFVGGSGADPDRLAVPLTHDPLTGESQQLPDLARARFDSGGAGLVGTAGDYLAFLRMLLAKGAGPTGDADRVLGRKTVELMLADTLEPGTDTRLLERPGWNPGHGFGLGVAVRRAAGGGATTPGSAGEVTWPGSSGAFWWADPAEDLGVVFLTHTPSRLQLRYWQQMKSLVLQALR
ncbi:serine hydrolase domain-containing protein [Kitasatospora sp. NPDC096077]|uniref:serine hydrolase domain-containing protein n=1 Tax=Kitasatospora sp. NPDC096077 TaxID=3155544 RepID=UPI003328D7D4